MKISISTFLAVIGVAICELKAPYLPSGWKPKGPAFELPTEVKTTAAEAETTTIISEVEADESLSFKEYGPPQADDILQDISIQALPDLEAITNFRTVEKAETVFNNGKNSKVETVVTIEKTEEVIQEKTENVKESKEEKQNIVPQTTIVQNAGVSSGQETVVEGRISSQLLEQSEINSLKQSSESSFKSIQESLNVLEKEIEKVEVREESLIETVNKDQRTEENQPKGKSAESEVPIGFSEYGVPHQEYGPPKGKEASNGENENIAPVAARNLEGEESEKISEDPTTEAVPTESTPTQSENRKRRFSSRIRTLRH